jgi:hypothetical protein
MSIFGFGAWRRCLVALLLLAPSVVFAQSTRYSVLIDSDNDPATGCSVATPSGSVGGFEARLDALVAIDPPAVQGQQLSLCSGGSFGAAQAVPGSYPVGIDTAAGPADVIELGIERALLGEDLANDWRLLFLADSPLLGAVDAAGPVVAVAIGQPPLPPPVPRPAVIPAASAWALMLLCLGLGLAAAWTLRRHPGLMLAALMVGALSSAGVAWAAGYLLDGQIDDWDVPALLTDPAGDPTQPEPQVDIRAVYAAREAGRVFFRFDVAETRLPVIVPPFLTTSFSVDENSPNATVVGSINTAPTGLASLLRFNLTGQTPSAGFTVDTTTGEVRVADSAQLDFETRPSFSLQVAVSLQGAPGFNFPVTVTVALNDRNEAPQAAAQSFSVLEGSANGTAVGSFLATDVDAGANGTLSYAIVGGSGQTVFAINAGSGAITVSNAAGLTVAGSPYTLQVQVSDGGAPALSTTATATITVTNINDAPSFTPGGNISVNEDSGAYSAAWATAIDDNDGGTQTLNFEFTANSNAALFATAPAISATGVLSFTPAADANGVANLTVVLRDNGGTANGGVDVSAPVNFSVTVTAVNDAPSFVVPAAAPDVLESAGPQTVANFATAISAGPADESGQVLNFDVSVTGTTGTLVFATAPALNASNGTLTYAAQNGTTGTATVSVILRDDGGTANGGIDASAAQVFTINVANVNDAPSFTPGGNIAVNEDSGAFSAAWASNINDNDGGTQALTFEFTGNSAPALFATAPAISPTGVLSFTPAANANGVANLTVVLRDNGGTAFGGSDTSAPANFTITLTAVNDAPSFVVPALAPTVFQNDGPQTVAAFATLISAGPADEAGQVLTFDVNVTGTTGNLAFAGAPAINPSNGTLTYAAQNGTSGTATVSVVLRDNGGTANGGVDASAPQVFSIEVVNVNDAPSFTPGGNVTVNEDSGAYSAAWASNINDNDGGTQTLNFEFTANSNAGLFAAAPAISPTGVLSFTPAANANGVANLTVVLRDNGGTAFGGSDTSAPVNFSITVSAVNDAPNFSIPAATTPVLENAGAQTVAGFASAISAGPADESGQALNFEVTVTGTTGGLSFTAAPAIDASGTLTFTAAADSSGVATVSVVLRDNGGTANGGVDASPAQVFSLEVLFVNSAPVFTPGADVTVNEDSGAYSAAWATGIDDGDPGVTQTLNFVVQSNSNPGLFAVAPAVSPAGVLSFTPAANGNGAATLSVLLQDNGGTANGGVNTSAAVALAITVQAVNDPPTLTPPTNVAVHRHIGIAIGAVHSANLLNGVVDPDGAGGEPFTATVQTAAATAQGGRVSVAADGSFSYEPPASETLAADSFLYEVCDSGVPAPPACSTATATLALAGEAIWFVDDSAAAGGDGTHARPFQTLAAAVTAASTNTKIFKASGSYTGGVTLKNGQQLIGQATSGAFDTVFGIVPPAHAVARPSLGGAHPQLTTSVAATHGITLGSGNVVRGIEIGNTTGSGLLGANVGPLSLGELRIVGSGQALDLANGTVSEVGGSAFAQLSSSSGAQNVRLSNIGGTLNLGSGALSGATGTALWLTGGSVNLSYAGSISKDSAGRLIDIEGAGTGDINLSGNFECSASCGSGAGNHGLRVSGRTGGTLTFSAALKRFIGTSTNPAVLLQGNTGATINFSGGTYLGQGANPILGTALDASGGGTLSLNGAFDVFTNGAQALRLVGMSVSGAPTGQISSNGNLGAGIAAIEVSNSTATGPQGLRLEQQLILDHDDGGESGGGIALSNNTGSFAFPSVSRIVSANTVALRAVSAGTVSMGSTTPGELANNGGTVMEVVNTTIGSDQLRVSRVQAIGGNHGIILTNTGNLGGLQVLGTGGTCTSSANCTGGLIANSTSHGVSMNTTVAPAFSHLRIENTGGSGIQGAEVNGFSFASGSIDGSGTAGGIGSSNIAFNDTTSPTARNVYGAVSITDSILTNARYHGVELFNYSGSLSSVTMTGNTITSSTSAATSQGWGISLIAYGSASTVANVTAANIANNVITNFPGGGGIQAQGGNSNFAGPAGVFGTAGHATNIINITGNRIAGQSAANRIGAEGIVASVGGFGQGNFNISNNGTLANPITHVTGSGISNSAFGNATVTSLIENNVIVANNSFGSQGIGGGLAPRFGPTDVPVMTVTVRGNTISNTDGNGILLVARDTSGTLNARVQNNTVAAPLGGVRPGIRVDSGNTASGDNDTVCLNISGNTSAGSGGTQGIGLRKQGTVSNQFTFGINGMAATASPGVETYVNGLNPAGGGTLLISAASGFSNCNLP